MQGWEFPTLSLASDLTVSATERKGGEMGLAPRIPQLRAYEYRVASLQDQLYTGTKPQLHEIVTIYNNIFIKIHRTDPWFQPLHHPHHDRRILHTKYRTFEGYTQCML